MALTDETMDGGAQGDGDDDVDLDADTSNLNLGSFLTDSETLDGVSFQSASGINVARVAEAIIASVSFALAYSLTSLVDAVTTVYAGLIDGVGNFVGLELIDATVGVGTTMISGVWEMTLAQYGIIAWPIGLGVLILTFYVVTAGIEGAREVL